MLSKSKFDPFPWILVISFLLLVMGVGIVLSQTRADNAEVRYYSETDFGDRLIYSQTGYQEMTVMLSETATTLITIFPPACEVDVRGFCLPIGSGYTIRKTEAFRVAIGCWQVSWPGRIETCQFK